MHEAKKIISAPTLDQIISAMRSALSPEPEAWHEVANWETAALAVLDLYSPKMLAMERAVAAERERRAKVEDQLCTIEAHCTVLTEDAGDARTYDATVADLVACIRACCAAIRALPPSESDR